MKTKYKKDVISAHQQEELNGSALYEKVARKAKNIKECENLLSIANDERRHAEAFAKYSGNHLEPNLHWVRLHMFAQMLLGYTFLIKLLERGENYGIQAYREEIDIIPELKQKNA